MDALPSANDPILRLNALCPYFTMFPLEFPFRCLRHARRGEWVLDPFCGRGTTNFAARLRGLTSVGVDSNAVAVAVAAAKLALVKPEEVIDLSTQILRDGREPLTVPTGDFWSHCYHTQTLYEICKLREYFIGSCSNPAEVTLRALVLGGLHGPRNNGEPSYLSNQMPRTYATKPEAAVRFWSKHKLKPERVRTAHLITRRAWFSLRALPPGVPGTVLEGDSRVCDLSSNGQRFSWVITSPPYFGMRMYRPDQWLRNWFLGGLETVDYRATDQIACGDVNQFMMNLASVWRNVANVCERRAKLVVRFGSLPSVPSVPKEVLCKSLKLADARWRVTTVKDAGSACSGNRQAEQFRRSVRTPMNELDLYAVLES